MAIIEAEDEATGDPIPITAEDQRLNVNARAELDTTAASKDGRFFSFTSTFNANDNDYTAFLRNDDALDFNIVAINVSNKTATQFSIFKAEGAGSGGVLEDGVNWNFSSGNTAGVGETFEVEFRQDPSNGSVTPVTILDNVWLPDNGKHTFDLYGSLILGDGDAIAVQVAKGDDDTTTVIIGFFDA